MKAILISTLILLGFFAKSQSEFFEGIIKYNIEIPDRDVSTLHYYIKDTLYRFDISADEHVIEIYNGGDSILWLMNSTNQYSQPLAELESTLISYKKKKEKRQIMGYWCNSVDFIYDDKTVRHWYQDSLSIDKSLFSKSKSNYSATMSIKGAISLGIEEIYDNYSIRMTAYHIKRKELTLDSFMINKILESKL